MRLNWKVAGMFLALLFLGAGCGGLHVSKSISPATFLLPGLLKADPPPVHPELEFPADEPVTEIAQF